MFISTNSNPLVTENKKEITSISRSSSSTTLNLSTAITAGTYYIHSSDGLYNFNVSGTISGSTFILNQSSKIHGNVNSLDWFNCFSFGQGVESNRIKDDFNAPFMDKGPIVSSTISSQYKQDLKKSGFIWSGIINSISGINDLNQFIQAETITKEINPGYGSIQKLLSRDTDLIAFCEDKILRILSNKDAIYNANGNINLISVDSVLGQAVPYLGEYGVSKNPESVADFGFRIYFTDKVRGLVLRLSRDGITEISDKGMTNWFSTNLRQASVLFGSFNDNKGCYDLTLNNYTLSFDERVDGWTSFKSFLPENSVSLNNIYYTFKNGELWSHTSTTRNNFYNVQYDSSITTIFNDVPSSIKSFKTINYEGSLSRKYSYNGNNSSYTKGWYCNSILTEKQTGSIKEFKKQEDLWSNYILGDSTNIVNINTKEFTVQGIGSFASIDNSERTQAVVTVGFVLDTNNDGIILPQDFTFNQAINTSSDKSFSVIIKPSDGYSILYGNFQATDTTFTQDGNNIIASVQKNYTTNVVDTITITATSSLIENTLSTSYETVYKNTSQSSIISSPTIYSNTPGTTAQIFTHTVNSSSGYVFSTEPKAVILTSNGTSGTSMYSITNNWSANATEVIFTINYIFGLTNVIGDKLLFIAEATKQYVSPGLKITSIYVPTKTISKFGETRTINIIGSPGATFTLKRSQQARDIINNNLSGSAIIYFLQGTNLWDSAETTLTIPASGVYSFSEKYVEASDNYYYSYLVTATGQSTRDGSFYGRNYVDNTYDVLVKQILDVTLYIDFNSDNQSSYYTINPSSQSTNYSITSSYGLHEPKSGSSKALISVTKTIRSTNNYTLSEIRTPDYYDFRFTTSRVALTDPSTSFNQLKIYSNNFIGYDSIQTGSIATWTDAAGTYKERKVDSLNEPYRTQVILETSGEFDGNENDPHSLPTGSFVTFIADDEWEFNIKNISTILSADTRDYTITFDVEVAKYGLANLYSYIDLTNFIQATIISSPSQGATAPPTTSKRRSLVAIENDIQISSMSFYTGNLSIYTNIGTTQTVGGTGTPPAGTGIITGNFSGNALSEVGLTATADDGAVVTGFTIGSLYFPNITNTTGDPNWGWSISGGTYYGGQNSTIMFTWEANIAANITLSSNLGVNFDLTLVNYP